MSWEDIENSRKASAMVFDSLHSRYRRREERDDLLLALSAFCLILSTSTGEVEKATYCDTLIFNGSSSASAKLAAYYGKADFGGQSGSTIEQLKSNCSAEEQYLKITDFVASFQNETVSLPAAMSIRSRTSGNIVFDLSTIADSKVCVTYTYEPRGSWARKKGDY